MIRRAARARSGITLTEILISILIMGVGVISIATLFPLGLLRLRNAQRLTRGAYLVESAIAELGTRDLLYQGSFKNINISPWYQTATTGAYYPWTQDTPAYGSDWKVPASTSGLPAGVSRSVVPGLPVAYDPLWRCVTGIYPNPVGGTTNLATTPYSAEARFGSGIGFVRNDPNPGTSVATPSAHGLQRLTNLQSYAGYSASGIIFGGSVSPQQFLANNFAVLQTFVSPEDMILQDPKGTYADPTTGNRMTNPNPLVPALDPSNNFAYENDWRYTWLFTGSLASADGTIFEGDIVICENRPFGMEQVNGTLRVTGETVVEAVWGYTSAPATSGSTQGYGSLAGLRSVLLRWPSSSPDPEIKVGGWIADVTYERNQNVIDAGRFPNMYQGQRCDWYQVAKKSEATPDPGFPGDPNGVTFRRMTVWTTTPVRSQSLLNFPGGGAQAYPVHVEAALIMPSVVNVYPRTVYSR